MLGIHGLLLVIRAGCPVPELLILLSRENIGRTEARRTHDPRV